MTVSRSRSRSPKNSHRHHVKDHRRLHKNEKDQRVRHRSYSQSPIRRDSTKAYKSKHRHRDDSSSVSSEYLSDTEKDQRGSSDRPQMRRQLIHGSATSWNQQSEFMLSRRRERETIGTVGIKSVWGVSPNRVDGLSSSDESENRHSQDSTKHKKKKSKKSCRRSGDDISDTELSKRKRKKHKRKKASSEASTSAESAEEWVEITKETLAEGKRPDEVESSEDEDVVGPVPGCSIDAEGRRTYGEKLLPGEGAAMAAYIAQGKRIPRRGEIGLTSDEIEKYEDVGYVMSGTRHRRMEATRLRKENQVYSAEEKRMLQTFSKEERQKKESKILSQFRDLVQSKMQ